jgi:putative sigma-54 modulation protein
VDVIVSGRQMDVSEKLRQLTEDKVSRLGRFLDMERAEVRFSREKNPRIANPELCEVTLEGHGHHVRAKVAAVDSFAAVDGAVAKAEQQLTKLKTRLVQRSRHAKARNAQSLDDVSLDGSPTAEPQAPDGPKVPRIVKSKRFAMMPMTPEDASHRMELLGHGFFFFTNIDTHRAAVVYVRDDGDIGLIDEAD